MKIEWKIEGTNGDFSIYSNVKSVYVLTNSWHVLDENTTYEESQYLCCYVNDRLEKFIKRLHKLERL